MKPAVEDVIRVACKLWGSPNPALSNQHELRFGTNGSKSLDLRHLRWFDHEANKGGGYYVMFKMADEPLPEGITSAHIRATYDYRDEHGALLYQVVRMLPKTFRQRRPDPTARDGWAWNIGGVRRVLYRLPELLAADSMQPVFIAEGEKDVDNLRALGFVATTNSGGAGKWSAECSENLRGRDVVILPDNDQAGRDHAAQVRSNLVGIARSLRVLALPDLPEKGDVSDWISGGGTAEALLRLLQQQDGHADSEPDWPEPLGLDATPGIIGEILAVLMPQTEADKAALLFQFLAAFGNIVGSGPHYQVEADHHWARCDGDR